MAEPGKGRNLGAGWVGPEAAPEAYRLILPSKYEVPAGRDFRRFWMPKRHEKSTESGTLAARGRLFRVSGGLLGQSEDRRICGGFTAGAKSAKMAKKACRGGERRKTRADSDGVGGTGGLCGNLLESEGCP